MSAIPYDHTGIFTEQSPGWAGWVRVLVKAARVAEEHGRNRAAGRENLKYWKATAEADPGDGRAAWMVTRHKKETTWTR